jgi:hypothetical protein
MIKANELRIGNYLLNDGVLVKIDARSVFDIWDDKGLKDYKPVPLTEEWLVRLPNYTKWSAFGDENYGGYIKFGRFGTVMIRFWGGKFIFYLVDIAKRDSYWKEIMKLKIECDYVHQLQNLYWCLCGEELILDNNEVR